MKTYFVRYLVFGLVLFAVVIGLGMVESNYKVRESFDDSSVTITSKRYSMNVPYDLIASVELTGMPDRGEVVDGTDDMTVRTGVWNNEVWGEYYVCADPDSASCVVMHLKDGRIFVFSLKNDEATIAAYTKLLECVS